MLACITLSDNAAGGASGLEADESFDLEFTAIGGLAPFSW